MVVWGLLDVVVNIFSYEFMCELGVFMMFLLLLVFLLGGGVMMIEVVVLVIS